MNMKADEQLSTLSHTAQSLNGFGLAIAHYAPAQVTPPWPPAIARNAEFHPMEKFTSMMQIVEMRRTFDIRIRQAAYNRMMFYVMNAPGEVSGYGKVSRDGNAFTVEDVIILEQTNGPGHSTITPETTLKFKLMMKKRKLSTEDYRLWWHSHNDFGVFFSTTDQDQIESLTTEKFTLSIVVNKMLDHRCRVDFYRPVRYGMDHLPLKIVPEVDPERAAELKLEMEKLAKNAVRRNR